MPQYMYVWQEEFYMGLVTGNTIFFLCLMAGWQHGDPTWPACNTISDAYLSDVWNSSFPCGPGTVGESPHI